MKNWQVWTLIILGAMGLIALGYLLHSPPKPSLIVKENVRYDTVRTTQTVKFTETKYIDRPIYIDSARTYIDSVMGTKDEVDYKIKHTISDNQKVLSSWEVNLEPHLQNITKYIMRDSIQTKVDVQYFNKPFFLDNWFYTSLVELGVIVLLLVKVVL